MTFVEAVAALRALTLVGDMDERPYIARDGSPLRITLSGDHLYEVRISDYQGQHNVWSVPYAVRTTDIFADDWEIHEV